VRSGITRAACPQNPPSLTNNNVRDFILKALLEVGQMLADLLVVRSQRGRLTAYDRRLPAAIGSTIYMLSWRDSEYYRLKDRISSGEAQREFNEDLKSDWLKFE
jgi:hypothetical protein